MSSPAAVFRAAVEAALRGSAALSTAMGGTLRIYTEVPPAPSGGSTPLPYVVIGQRQIVHDEEDDCTKPKEIFETIHVWSRKSTLDHGVQADAMSAAIVTALTTLSVSGWFVDLRRWTEQPFTDPDQSTHLVITLEYDVTNSA